MHRIMVASMQYILSKSAVYLQNSNGLYTFALRNDKTTYMEEEKGIISQKYINTPFAYTRTQKGLTLLQQNIMVKVAMYLQVYMERYFQDAALVASTERPKPIMTESERDNLPPIRLELSDLGVSSSSYSRVRDALDELLSVKVEKDDFDEEGKPIKKLMNLFSKVYTPVTDKGTTVRKKLDKESDELTDVQVDRTRGYVDLHLNKDVVFEALDMNLGYVTHPDNIARIGKVDNMPLMYYFVRHKMQNFKLAKAQATPEQLRDYLGMIKRDPYGNVTKVQYPRWSMFRDRIIKTALDDIRRVYDAGQIDFYFEMNEIRPRGKKIGEPSLLEFRKVGTNKKDEAKHRANAEKKLAKTLLELYPTLQASRVKEILASVPAELWDGFKTYAYNDVPKAVEQPHRWNGTHEEFIYFLLTKWITSNTTEPVAQEKPVQGDLFAGLEKPGEMEWGTFLKNYKGVLAGQLRGMSIHSFDVEKGLVSVEATPEQEAAFNALAMTLSKKDQQKFLYCLYKAFGKDVRFGFFVKS